ncbi:MAG: hypothetical protein ACRDRJ_27530 [Streptosporangiaceae bacterium]
MTAPSLTAPSPTLLVVSAHAADLTLRARMVAQARGHESAHPPLGAPPVFRFEPHQPEMREFTPDVLVDISAVVTPVVVTGPPRTPSALVAGLGGYGVATVHEALGRRGLLGADLRPAWPGVRAAGAA